MSQKEKTKFRQSKEWKEYRKQRKEEDKVDFITNKKLYSSFNLHHLDLNEDNYTNLEDNSHFVCLNKQTHEVVHWLYRYYKNDPSVIDRLRVLMEVMDNINS